MAHASYARSLFKSEAAIRVKPKGRLCEGTNILEAAFIDFQSADGRQHKAWGVSPRIKDQK
jgi:hypothetical protein